MKQRFLTYIILIGLIYFSCKKAVPVEPTLPPISQTGANTFGCILNGKIWLPEIKGSIFVGVNDLEVDFEPISKKIYVIGKISNDTTRQSIKLFLEPVKENQTYELLNSKNSLNFAIYSHTSNYNTPHVKYNQFQTDEKNRGTLHLSKFDTINRIASGIFEFQAISDSGEVIIVKDGRFDVRF